MMIIGFILLALGIFYLLEILIPGFKVDFQLVWPILLIVIGIYSSIKQRKFDVCSMILIFLGVWFLGIHIGLFPKTYRKIFWPLLLIIVGLHIILDHLFFHKKFIKRAKELNDGIRTYYGVFSGVDERVSEGKFIGADLYAIFGGIDLDLRKAKAEDGAIINLYSIFGGSTLIVPEGYNLEVSSSSFFGGIENKTNNEHQEKNKTIYINCLSVFGGNELK